MGTAVRVNVVKYAHFRNILHRVPDRLLTVRWLQFQSCVFFFPSFSCALVCVNGEEKEEG